MNNKPIEARLIENIKNDLIKQKDFEMAAKVREVELNQTTSLKGKFEIIYNMVSDHQFQMDQRENKVGDVIELDPKTSELYMEAFELGERLRFEAECLLVKANEYQNAALAHVINKNPSLKEFRLGISNDGTKAMILGYSRN